jgi:hypothetical protein
MTSPELLAIAALGLFAGVSLWLGFTDRTRATAPALPDDAAPETDLIRTPLLTPEQGALYHSLTHALDARGDGLHALPQAPLDALLAPRATEHAAQASALRRAIACCRVDVGILGPDGRILAAAAVTPPDAITCAALDRAGIPLIVRAPQDPGLAAALSRALDTQSLIRHTA